MIYVLLCAYNEERALSVMLPQIRAAYGPAAHAVVVNDGSRDGTELVLRGFAGPGLTVLTHTVNQGLGMAIRTGLLHLAGRVAESDIIVTMDADDTHPVELIGRLAARCADADVVIASRYRPGGGQRGVVLLRNVLSRAARVVLSLRFHVPGVRDYTSGFRAYRGAILRRLVERYGDKMVTERDFVVQMELLLKLARTGARFAEEPLLLRYDRKEGASKMKVWRTVKRYLWFVFLRREHVLRDDHETNSDRP
jgi:dolichol-phosphate mannosyltransferase